MRSTSERVAAVERRTRDLKLEKNKKQTILIGGISSLLCIAVILLAALAIPTGMAQSDVSSTENTGAAAGVFTAAGTAGYFAIGLLAFVLGCSVTILCFRLYRRGRGNRNDRDH